jgi:hypothetical protein
MQNVRSNSNNWGLAFGNKLKEFLGLKRVYNREECKENYIISD